MTAMRSVLQGNPEAGEALLALSLRAVRDAGLDHRGLLGAALRRDRLGDLAGRHHLGEVPRLARPHAAAHPLPRRRRGHGQHGDPPRQGRSGRDRGGRLQGPLPPSLQPRPQPHREDVVEGQGGDGLRATVGLRGVVQVMRVLVVKSRIALSSCHIV